MMLTVNALFCGSSPGQQSFHGAGILKSPVGPNGTIHARTGDVIRATITVVNMDDFGDSITLTGIYDTNHHWGGAMVSPNLLAQPIKLDPPSLFGGTNFVEVTYSYPVLPGDENLPLGILPDTARADGFDNHDGNIGGLPTYFRESFFVTFPAQILVETNVCVPSCALGAWSDPAYRPSTKPPDRNQAFWARGISTNLVFYPNPGSWTENPDGTAQLNGVLRSLTNLASGFAVTMNLSGRQSTPPAHSPMLELDPKAYVQNGGPINPSLWYYYANFSGTLTGFGFWQGAVISFKPDPAFGAFQVGVGANGKNTGFGATGWWDWTVVKQPASGNLASQTVVANINLDLTCCQPSNCIPSCVIAAFSDPTYRPASKPPGRNQVVWMKGISTNLIFSPDPGSWVENGNGTAQMTGTVRSLTNTTSGFTVVLNLSGRTSSGPAGSPKLELDPSAYVANGGPLDPSKWYYYPSVSGTLTGFGFWQGAVINLVPMGPAFQVGVGANGKNQNYGASAWFSWTIAHQPASGSLPTTGEADINVDLICCP